jgi:cyclopropane fatty-acyl-phospholipid synthase-like methyltransferase
VKNINEVIKLKNDAKILEYGCGTGLVSFALSTETNSILMGITLFLSICCYAMESLNDWCEKQIKIVDTENNKE